MKYDITGYRVTSVNSYTDNLKVFMQYKNKTNETSVLELEGVIGYFDLSHHEKSVSCIRIDETGGSYNFDLSLRLDREEIKDYPEVFIFKDPKCVEFIFRAVAKTINFRKIESRDNWMKGW
jgi:hypothetical protein